MRAGSVVLWRGSFGTAPERPAVVVRIERVNPGGKYGEEARRIPNSLPGERFVVDLANGHWAYGWQVRIPRDRVEAARALWRLVEETNVLAWYYCPTDPVEPPPADLRREAITRAAAAVPRL